MIFLVKGFVLGFSIAAPVGAIGLLCIRRTLTDGKLAGFVTGLGAATADALYAAVAAFGLTAISSFLLRHESGIKFVGSIFLFYLAVTFFFSKTIDDTNSSTSKGLLSAYGTTIFLTLTNPSTIISFIAAFAALGVVSSVSYNSAIFMVAGVFLGSTIWWAVLSSFTGFFRHRITPYVMLRVNRGAGILMGLLGLYALLS